MEWFQPSWKHISFRIHGLRYHSRSLAGLVVSRTSQRLQIDVDWKQVCQLHLHVIIRMKINNLFSKLSWDVFSAGGTGVMLNLDRVTDFLRTQGSTAEVRGVTDSGWFLDNVPYAPADCQDPQRCAPTSAVQMGHSLWNGQVPLACKAQYVSQPWRCYFGHHLHRTLKSTSIISTQSMININHLSLFLSLLLTAPLFIFQWLFDEAQMLADNVGPPMSKEQWDYIHAVGDDLRRTFTNVS